MGMDCLYPLWRNVRAFWGRISSTRYAYQVHLVTDRSTFVCGFLHLFRRITTIVISLSFWFFVKYCLLLMFLLVHEYEQSTVP